MTMTAYDTHVAIKRKEERKMLVIDVNSAYEIDEECVKKRGVSKHCGIDDKLAENKGTIRRPKESGADCQQHGLHRERF